MGRLTKLTKRTVASCLALAGASVLAPGLFLQTANAAVPVAGPCSALSSPTYISGSSAVKPVLAGLSATIASTTTLVYFSNGSCVGVGAIVSSIAQTASNGTYWTAANVTTDNPTGETQCTLSATQVIDVGVSDVFPTTCPGITQEAVTAGNVGDFHNFFAQVMEFVVPSTSDQVSISAEAAYLTFGFEGDAGGTTWDNTSLRFIRNETSGTQAMLAKAINLGATKWKGTNAGSSGGVVTAIGSPSGDPKRTIGILSSGEADASPSIKKLAYQGYGQTCAFWADSGASQKDKLYVRDGHYPVWGPLHLLAKVDSKGVATDAKAKALIDLFAAQEKSVVDVEINANVVPLCAMNVTRDTEVGPLMSIQPTGACGCYFDSKRNTAGAGKDCKVCTKSSDCTGAAKVCNYGYCEVK